MGKVFKSFWVSVLFFFMVSSPQAQQDAMEQALKTVESVCGETYTDGFLENDHYRFFCMAAFNDYCALKRAESDDAISKLQASLQQNCATLNAIRERDAPGTDSKCPYCGPVSIRRPSSSGSPTVTPPSQTPQTPEVDISPEEATLIVEGASDMLKSFLLSILQLKVGYWDISNSEDRGSVTELTSYTSTLAKGGFGMQMGFGLQSLDGYYERISYYYDRIGLHFYVPISKYFFIGTDVDVINPLTFYFRAGTEEDSPLYGALGYSYSFTVRFTGERIGLATEFRRINHSLEEEIVTNQLSVNVLLNFTGLK